MRVFLCLIYGDSSAGLQTWGKLLRNAEIYRGYLVDNRRFLELEYKEVDARTSIHLSSGRARLYREPTGSSSLAISTAY